MIEPGSKEYFKKTAERVILEYIRGLKKRATLNWVLGVLRKMIEYKNFSLDEIQNIISEIETDPSLYSLDKFAERRPRLNRLRMTLNASSLSK